jgi:hypothetical protein
MRSLLIVTQPVVATALMAFSHWGSSHNWLLSNMMNDDCHGAVFFLKMTALAHLYQDYIFSAFRSWKKIPFLKLNHKYSFVFLWFHKHTLFTANGRHGPNGL